MPPGFGGRFEALEAFFKGPLRGLSKSFKVLLEPLQIPFKAF